MNSYMPTIGLEIHAELKTRTKMFCDSKNDPDEARPNVNICPICLGHPGTLPTVNKEAVRHVLRVGVAVGGKLADYTEFDRKNYFYPDIPKGYQISQYKYPLVSGGVLGGVNLTRIHLEEDTARSQHMETGESLIDFNRAGVPLMELVTEPVIHDGRSASEFAKELQLLLRYLGVGEANMEKGEMRVEANISVSKSKELGTKVEVKNLNSFKTVWRAIDYEIERQIGVLDAGGAVEQETRGWDEIKQKTVSQRKKETSNDYRYFPDPDIPPLEISKIPGFSNSEIQKSIGELPDDRRKRYEIEFKLKEGSAETLVSDPKLAVYFESVVKLIGGDQKSIQIASNYLLTDVMGLLSSEGLGIDDIKATPKHFAEFVELITSNIVTSRGAKDILKDVVLRGVSPKDIAKSSGKERISDENALASFVAEIIQTNPEVARDYSSGKTEALQFMIGQVMKRTRGAGDPRVIGELLQRSLRPIK